MFSVMVNNSVRLKPLKLCTMMLVSCIRCGTFVLVFVAVTLLRGTGDAVCVNCCVCVCVFRSSSATIHYYTCCCTL